MLVWHAPCGSSRGRCGWPNAWTCRWDPADSSRWQWSRVPCTWTDRPWNDQATIQYGNQAIPACETTNLQLPIWCRNLGQDLFIWARLTEISPSRYFLCKNSDVFIWELGQPVQPRFRSRRPGSRLTGLIWALQPGWPGWNVSIAHDWTAVERPRWQCLALSAEFSISKVNHLAAVVTRVDKATTRSTIEISSRGAILIWRLAPLHLG